ncbi:MAG: hypothetical protein A2W52_00885 [Candidatus Taylorbacteria bacterium RIFCSPHIGHO2_02_49_25]|uniref:Cytidyltransferase-like domain-containing protein n=1 Tax=Candidatus Taylorbacteria bacterium RIFCSPHIGHO2_02_49_25 TaxID=1802305 RepID=A0A1G2MAP4_9BACT|nr:MAG: Glycerol-3-phosphate cytidylyltransferase [Parcubacteria group bacterium GW2011_GWF2_50_9]OHA19994.1 MAG: hypothetical protein A2759_00160 [Candidatus Taylorbacteria bacterium RIFCSPHIGHO2_01_FULL_49_60]OHA20938.1 MAG: hypothetical protein A2W52_00885 [Candidatus Taylorbacteria bacterium RIFCSPHIGHO2_02_49_25]OHA36089.1 MAG: hypothetical protein A3B27_03365 [Candidatus Taylorbacteria bacterium RIFCSPLOWO2_01_FULL_50_130]OHA37237.1 MAG: hypothetical protein A2W65_03130 [Candidatus Taylor
MRRNSTARKEKKKTVAVSGGFDPVHIGHVRLLNAAKKFGDRLVVILNNDNWLISKKGFVFISENDRKEILESFFSVNEVMITSHKKNDPDRSVCRELLKLRPHIFANGGDRNLMDSKKKSSSLNSEIALCARLGIKTVFNVGSGGKLRSSTELVSRFKKV